MSRAHPRHGGGSSRRRKRVVRTTEVKIRVRVHRPMSRETLLAKIIEVIESGVVPRDFDLLWWDYAHKRGGVWKAGDTLGPDDVDSLAKFAGMIGTIADGNVRVGGRAGVRVSKVDSTGYNDE